MAQGFFSTPQNTDKLNVFEAKAGFKPYDFEYVDDVFVCNKFSVGVGFTLGKRTWYLPNGIDTDIFKPEGNNCREKMGIPKDAFVFLYSGSNINGKDPCRALLAFSEFVKKNNPQNCYLVMHTRPVTDYLNLPEKVKEFGVEDKVKYAIEILELYAPELLKELING
jgi:glycosyltransferase involved in cell wall biosynthesis